MLLPLNSQCSTFWTKIIQHGVSLTNEKVVYLDKFSFIANILQEWMVCCHLTNFGQSRQIFKHTTKKNLFRVKTEQNRLLVNKQNRGKLVDRLSEKLGPTCNRTEISLLERQKFTFVVKLGDSKILKLLKINPRN